MGKECQFMTEIIKDYDSRQFRPSLNRKISDHRSVVMKKSLIICLLLLLFFGCKTSGTTYPFYTQESYVTPGRHVIKSADGKVQGYLQQSKIDRRRTVQYNKNGNEVGYWQKSPIDSRKTVFHKK